MAKEPTPTPSEREIEKGPSPTPHVPPNRSHLRPLHRRRVISGKGLLFFSTRAVRGRFPIIRLNGRPVRRSNGRICSESGFCDRNPDGTPPPDKIPSLG